MKWMRIILWIPAVFVALVVGLVGIAVLLVQISPWIRRDILGKVERDVAKSSGAHVEIRDFKLDLPRFGLKLFGVVVHGPEGQSATPLLHIEQIVFDIKLSSAFQRQVHLRNLVIHRPVVHVSMARLSGGNLPQPKVDVGAGMTTIFNLAIQKCIVDGGEVHFSDVKRQLEAEVYNLQLAGQLNGAMELYHGDLSYSKGIIRYDGYAPVVHELQASFIVTPAKITLERLEVVGRQSRIMAYGVLSSFSSPVAQGAYDVQFSATDLAVILKNAPLTGGVAHLTGSLTYYSRNNRSFVQNARLSGNLTSPILKLRLPTGRMEVRDVRANYELADGNLKIQKIGAQVFGGSLNASLIIREIAGASHSTLQSHLRDISVEQLVRAAQQFRVPEARLTGKISADADATWGRTIANVVVHSAATLTGAMGLNLLVGLVHADYAANHEIALHDSYIRTPDTSITLDGKVAPYSRLQVALRSSNIHELELLAANVRTAISGKPQRKLDLYGTASFNGSVTGLVTAPQLRGNLEVHNQRISGTSWKLLRANIDANPSAFSLSNGYLEGVPRGKINFSVRTGLNDWVYTPTDPINVEISASQIALSDVVRLADLRYPVSGNLSANASVYGSQLHPVGYGEISLADGKILSEPIQNLNLGFRGDDTGVHASIIARLLAGTAQAEVTLDPETRKYLAHVQANKIHLEGLEALKRRNQSFVGLVSLVANGNGVISSPELTAKVEVSQLQVHEQMIPDLTLEASLHNRVAEISLHSDVEPALVKGYGTVESKPPFLADLHLDTGRFSFQPILAIYAPDLVGAMRAQTELHASLRGGLQSTKYLEAHLDIPVLTVSYRDFQLSATNVVRMDYRNGVLDLKHVSVQGTGVDLQIQATVPMNNPGTAEYLLEGTVDLSVAQLLQPELKCTGQIQFDLNSRKRIPGSDFDGELRLVNTSIHNGAIPLGLDSANGVLGIGRTRVEVKSFQAQAGGGTVTAKGGITFRPAMQVDLRLSGSSMRLRYPKGVRAILESNLTLIGDKQTATLGGTVEVQSLSLTPDLDLTGLLNQFSEQDYSSSPSRLAQHVRLDVTIESAPQVDVVSTRMSFRGNAHLQLLGTAAEPIVQGRANLNGGDLFIGGNRYVMQDGSIDFLNPLRTEPVVNVRVKTKIDQYVINLKIEGPIERLNTTYTSQPLLPAVDIINLLAFGKTTEATGDNPLNALNLGAQSALVQGLGNALSSRVTEFVGLSYFSINPVVGGSNQEAGARVVLQHRVTSNLVVTYSSDVTSTQRQSIQLEYTFKSRWSVNAARNQNGGFGASALFHTSF